MSNTSKGTRERVAAKKTTAAPGGEVARVQPSVYGLIESMKPEIARVLPQHMSPDRMARIATTVVRQTPRLLRCTPESLLGALMTCAQLGLEPGPLGHAYLVPYGEECTLIIGYKGLIDLARRSGHIESLVAREVYANDEFEVEYGLEEKLYHKPQLDGSERGEVTVYYAVARYTGGGYTFLVMTKADIEKLKARSRASGNGPWQTDYDAMAKKTVIRQLAKFLPMSVEMATAIAQDDKVRTVVSADDLELPVTAEEDDEAEVVDAEVVETPPTPQEPTTGPRPRRGS
jgi:recombination protein RecT